MIMLGWTFQQLVAPQMSWLYTTMSVGQMLSLVQTEISPQLLDGFWYKCSVSPESDPNHIGDQLTFYLVPPLSQS